MNYEKSKNVELKKNGPIAMTYLIVKFDIAIGPFYYYYFLELTTQPQHICSKKKIKKKNNEKSGMLNKWTDSYDIFNS